MPSTDKPNAVTEQSSPEGGIHKERGPRIIDVRDLLGDARETIILHGGEQYRLRVTSNDKLILTK